MSIANAAFTRNNAFSDDKERCFPRFYEEAIQDEPASIRAGRPIFRIQERVQIMMPGNSLNSPVSVVSDEHRQRWPEAYKAFKDGLEMSHEGTPIEQAPFLNKAICKELKHREVHTVEQLANLDDLAIQRIGMGGMEMRKMARAYLDDGARLATVQQLDAENAKLKDELGALRLQVEQLGELLKGTHSALVAKQNEPNPIAASVPYQMDQFQAGAPTAAPVEHVESAIAAFAKRGPGRPKKQ